LPQLVKLRQFLLISFMKKILIFTFSLLTLSSFVIVFLSFFDYIQIEKRVNIILSIILFVSIFFMLLFKSSKVNVSEK
jgi:hypothetical protein